MTSFLKLKSIISSGGYSVDRILNLMRLWKIGGQIERSVLWRHKSPEILLQTVFCGDMQLVVTRENCSCVVTTDTVVNMLRN